MARTYLFDLDGTLIDTSIYARCYERILSMITRKRHLTPRELAQKARRLGLVKNEEGRWDTGDLCQAFNLLEEYYKILKAEVKQHSFVQEQVVKKMIESHSHGHRIGIVSNSMRKTIKLYLSTYKLTKYVHVVFSREDAGCRKNSITFWKKLISKYNLNPKECTIIGNNPLEDGTIPKKVGFHTILVNYHTT